MSSQFAFLTVSGISIVSSNVLRQLGEGISKVVARDGATRSALDSKRRIMVVDDEKDISMIFKSGLTRNGFDVDVFDDPKDALSHYKSDYYDLLLLDIRMPGMSGFELFREILKIDGTAKACFVSAFEIPKQEFAEYLQSGENGCIIKKPVSMIDLMRIVNEELSSD
jgi:DNA-binding response OmpR family regulator